MSRDAHSAPAKLPARPDHGKIKFSNIGHASSPISEPITGKPPVGSMPQNHHIPGGHTKHFDSLIGKAESSSNPTKSSDIEDDPWHLVPLSLDFTANNKTSSEECLKLDSKLSRNKGNRKATRKLPSFHMFFAKPSTSDDKSSVHRKAKKSNASMASTNKTNNSSKVMEIKPTSIHSPALFKMTTLLHRKKAKPTQHKVKEAEVDFFLDNMCVLDQDDIGMLARSGGPGSPLKGMMLASTSKNCFDASCMMRESFKESTAASARSNSLRARLGADVNNISLGLSSEFEDDEVAQHLTHDMESL